MPIRNQINREARGFLSFFRAKVGGQGPQFVDDLVRPTIDVGRFTSISLLRGATTTAVGNPAANLSIAVPDDEFWQLYAIHLTISSTITSAQDTGAVWALQIQGLPDGAGAVTDLTLGTAVLSNQGGAANSVGGGCSLNPNGDLIVPGGVNIQGQYVRDNTTANYNVTLSVLYGLITV